MPVIDHADGLIRRAELHLIPQLRIALQPLVIHPLQHGDMDVHIVVDTNLVLALVIPVKPTGVLRQCSAPRNRHRQQQSVQSRSIKSLSDVLSRGHHDNLFTGWYLL